MMSNGPRDESDHQLLMLHRIGRSSGWMAFFTLVIVIGGAVCAYLYWQQLTALQDQLSELQDLSSKIQKSLDVANTQSAVTAKTLALAVEKVGDVGNIIEKSLDVANTQSAATAKTLAVAVEKVRDIGNIARLLTLDRPWVGVDSISVSPLRPNRPLTIKAIVRNSGRSPAIDMRMTFRTATPVVNAVAVPEIKECSDCVRSILLPNTSTPQDVTIDGDELSAAKINRITSGDDTILLFARIDYADVAENHHTTTVCMAYVVSLSGFSACVHGNRLE